MKPFERVFPPGDSGVMVVLGSTGTTADQFHMAEDITCSSVYPDCHDDDEVYVCAYERALDVSPLGDWRRVDPDDLYQLVMGVGFDDVYYYPASCLERYSAGNWTQTPDGVRCEFCRSVTPTPAGWVEHFARGCSHG